MKYAERVLRVIALLIVVAAIIDPVFTVQRAVPPIVALLSADSVRHEKLIAQTERALSRTATVVRGPSPNAQAVVMVGSAWLTAPTTDSTVPHYVISSATVNGVHVEAIDAPTSWVRDARMSIRVRLARDSGASSSPVTLSLRDEGQLQVQQQATLAPHHRTVVSLPFTPVHVGTRALELAVVDGSDTLRYMLPVQISTSPWRVLVYDARPSWLSTFVRRALERDSRFVVSSRIVTSKDISVATPQSARSIETLLTQATQDAASLPHVIVVGAPERLTSRDVSALRVLMEEWGRAVVILPDHLPPQANIGALNTVLGVSAWRSLSSAPTSAPHAIVRAPGGTGDSLRLAASTIATPVTMPADATTLAVASGAPVVWTRPVGRGLLVTSGGFDAWRFRDPAQSTFDATWRELLASAAQDVNPAFSFARLGSAVGKAQTLTEALVVAARPTAALAPPAVTLIRDAGDSSSASGLPVAVFPTATQGTWLTQVRVPNAGTWRLQATQQAAQSGDTAVLPLIATADTQAVVATVPDSPDEQLATWTNTSGGQLVPHGAIDSLPAILETRLGSPRRPAPWHPMRSVWWILPLTLALGGDWWLRRRRGAR
ncbi:MAG: hypothetical protein IBJ03_04325 [Gemmatimonadaceae bacterium]|nr:hypothetical protein [Gemmatimonadaceae bacterium]